MKYDVFISYSRKDTEIANKICDAFDRNGITYFIDRQGIGGGFEFPEVLANAILDSKLFLYLASENAYKSKFTNSEITFAFNEKERNCILPYVIDQSKLPVAQRFVFSAINWRNIKDHPIDTVLVDDFLKLLGKDRRPANTTFIKDSQQKINGHEYVDLGLPSGLKWATCNVGANKPEDYGDYFAWGETQPKDSYTKENCKTLVKRKLFGFKGKKWGDILGNTQYDAAHINWRSSWRLPTVGEVKELVEKCTWTWTTQSGVKGYKVTGPNGNSIFLSAAGYRDGTSLNLAGGYGLYWSSSPCWSSTYYAYYLGFHDGGHGVDYYGRSVRPVLE